MTIDEAYRVQRQRADALAGYKIGCASPVMQAQMGIDRPVFGRVYKAELHRTGETLSYAAFNGLAIEGEIAVRLGSDLNVVAAFIVIELHHYAQHDAPWTAAELIACNCIHAGVVLPETEPPLADRRHLLEEPLSVYRNGELLGVASGSVLPGGPLASVERLTGHLAEYGESLLPGEIVLTGSPLPLYRVAPGDRIEVVSGRLGGRVWTIIDR